MLDSAKPDILVGSEAWLKDSINSSEFMPPGYDPPLRKDISDGYGGVMIAIRSGIIAEQIPIDSDCEIVGVKVQTNGPHPLIVLGVYRPTNNNKDYANFLCDIIQTIAGQFPNNPLWVTGDLNLPDIDWLSDTIVSHQYRNEINNTFLELFSTLGLSQIVYFPTRINNTLDVFLTNRQL